jgi:hypothetical protein
MGVIDKFEKKIAAVVDGTFARVFKGDVQPVEITARLQRELDSEAKLLSMDRRLVPNEFVVGLSQHDYDRLAPYAKTLNTEIVPKLREHASSKGFIFNGDIRVLYELDDSQPTGRFSVTSRAVADVAHDDEAASVSELRTARLVIEVNNVRHPLVPPGLTIGRGTEADLRINDPGISRRHAQISVTGRGPDQTVVIEDLGSTNGVIVNGQKVARANLSAGTRIEIGSTRLVVQAAGA